MSSVEPGKKRELFLIRIVVLLLFIGSFGNIASVQAQTFKRIQKDGVVYYFFSNRGEGSQSEDRAGQPYLKTGTNKIKVVPLKRKVAKKITPQELDPVVQEASQQYKLPAPLIKAVIRVESNFVPTATSPKGAQGLMQLMPGTAEDLQVRDAYDIKENVYGGARYLRMLLDKFGYRLPLALAAYNAGTQRVEKHQGVPPIKETQWFVRDVCVNFLNYSGEATCLWR